MQRTLARALPVLIVVLLLPGCGGGGGSSSTQTNATDPAAAQAVASALKEFVATGNYSKACSYYTSAAKAELATRAGGTNDCPATLAKLFRKVPASSKKQLRQIKITSVIVTGTHATAKDSAGGSTYLTKEGDKWLVDKTPKKSG